jgi:5-methyltetrahydrofolate--homocysteine methyltransferase
MEFLREIDQSMQSGDDAKVRELTQQAIDAGLSASKILNEGFLAGMAVVGRKMGARELFLPEVLMAARAMKAGVELLKPLLAADEVPTVGKVVVGTVKGDLHDIGKNLVGIMLEGAGFEVFDVGADVEAEVFVDRAEAEGANIIGLSALLTTTMVNMKSVIDLVRERGLENKVQVVVGGAPVTQEFADEIGADAYGYDANHAVGVIKELAGVAQ